MAYEQLLSPGRIGSLELRNRMIMTPMGEELGDPDGMLSDAQAAYLEARAAGGMACVMLGSVAVAYPVGCSNKVQTAIADDRHIPPWRAAAERVHAHGAALAMQLTHAGKNGLEDVMAGRPMWVPSEPGEMTVDPLYGMLTESEMADMAEPFSTPESKSHYRVMTPEDIETVIDQFAAATVRAREAGVDAVELHAGHGYLIDEFLSPATNHRDDDYGGPVENRARLLVEILQEIRSRIGDDYPVWVRINSTEVDIAGTVLGDAKVTARLAAEAGADAIHVSAYHDPGKATGPTEAYIPHTPDLLVPNAAAIKAAVDVPVIAVGRIDPESADRHIAAGDFDFVAMGRKILADPELPNKLAAGEEDDIRPCIYHYRCIGQIFVRKGTRCADNAFLGREDDLRITAAPEPRRVLVVGGGPAGMEAARVAALQGHQVTLAEAERELGGQWRLAAMTSAPNAELLAWLRRQIDKADIDVQLGTRIDARPADVDAVIVATGGRWKLDDDLAGWLDEGELVIVGGDVPGIGFAQAASSRGAKVTLVEESGVFGQALGLPGRWRLVADLRAAGVELVTEMPATNGARVIDARAPEPDTTLADALGGVAIGDAIGPGFLEHAMSSAVEAALDVR